MNAVHYMQVKKDNIRKLILAAAEKLFQKSGFSGTSMREIATASEIGLGNIYNYFTNKDDIFKAIVQPSVTRFMSLYERHHSKDSQDLMAMFSESYFESMVNEYISLIVENRSNYVLLFFKSQGSSFERFKDEFTDYATLRNKEYFADMKIQHPHVEGNISDFFVHFSISSMFNLFEELIMHKVSRREIKPIFEEYMRFNIAGWKELMKV